MKIKASSVSKAILENGDIQLQVNITDPVDKQKANYEYPEIKQYKEISVELKKYRKKRSLDANAYMWKLIYEIAVVVKNSSEEVYLMMLERYGISEQALVLKKAVDTWAREFKIVKVLKEKEVEGVVMVKLLCYLGSSHYDTKQFSHLLEGIIFEAKELGIETLDDIEQKRMIANYESN